MKKLNQQACITFSQMLQRLGYHIFISLQNEPYQPVTIRVADHSFHTTEGEGKILGISHTYEEPEELISTMELTLIVVDNRQSPTDYDNLLIWPVRYEHDNLDLDLISIELFDDGCYVPVEKYYDGNVEIAEAWLQEFQEKGFLS